MSTNSKVIDIKDYEKLLCASWDLQNSLSALEFLLEECDYELAYTRVQVRKFKAFEDKAIISFFKAYLDSPGNVVNKCAGVKLTVTEKQLCKRVRVLRNKIVAHTDEDFTHFRVDSIEVGDETYFPIQNFEEKLFFGFREVLGFQDLIKKIMRYVCKFLFEEIQRNPTIRNHYKKPNE
ncbi:hypothetical protein V6R97_06925 [Chromohalobacter salexigens]|uniref:hypothetical protein n=1 Tax=Chromohalobacter israelensis TaxID=141390 RepID=UPI0032E899C1